MGRLISFELKKIIKSKKNIIAFLVMLVLFVGYSSASSIFVNSHKMMNELMIVNIYLDNEDTSINSQERVKVNKMLEECKKEGKMTDEFLNWDINYCQNELKSAKSGTQVYENYQNQIITDKYMMSHGGIGPYDIYSYQGLFSLNSINHNLPMFFIIFFILFSCDVFNKEHKGGSLKTLMIQPFSKSKIVFSKYISTVIFTATAFTLCLLVNYIINTIAFGLVPIDYPMPLSDNFLNLSLFSSTSYCNLQPLYLIIILTYLLDICFIFAFSAICLLLSVALKQKTLSLAIPAVITLIFSNMFYKEIFGDSLLNIYSYSTTSLVLNSFSKVSPGRNPLTFLDGIVVPLIYAVVAIILSLVVMKRKQFDN